MRRRRPTGVLLLLLVAAIGVGAAATAVRSAGQGPASELRQRLEGAVEGNRFSFSYQRGGTRVLDCVLVNTRFDVDVDVAASRGGDPTRPRRRTGSGCHR